MVQMLLQYLLIIIFLGQHGVIVLTELPDFFPNSYDKNTFELRALSHSTLLEGILCEKGKVLADINFMASCVKKV